DRDGIAKGGLDQWPVWNNDGLIAVEAPRAQRRDEERTAPVLVDPLGGSRGAGDDDGAAGVLHDCPFSVASPSRQSPERPPDLATTRTSVMRACLSTALTISMRARAETATAVRASISMPVRSAVRTVAEMSTP